ncbi:MAG: hypothetical protein IKW99_01245 [Bacteroidales bacterium]|nr:hypothetical protein [Bacteroidales bacterium]
MVVTMEGVRNIKSLTMDELAGVIKAFPWFGAARIELCERMSKMGGGEWGKEQYADAALYVASRTIVSDIVRSSRKNDYSDKDVQTLLKRFIAPEPVADTPKPVTDAGPLRSEPYPGKGSSETVPAPAKTYRRTVRAAGADFFSSDEYEGVKVDEDNYFSKFKVARSEESDSRGWEDPELGFCTETLAWIYAEQGYREEAKKIYSRLMLRYPEKIAYFASLIEKLDEEIKK